MIRAAHVFAPCVLLASIVGRQSSDAAETIYVGAKVPANQRISMDTIDHAVFNALLRKHVDKNGMVDYTAWKASEDDRAALVGYLRTLSTADPRLKASRNARLAFWINAYNAVTLEGILRVYPTASIREHTAKLFGYNIWEDLQLYVGATPYSLEQIEHEILRKMSDPRIHFAIVCASIGCPRLLNEAYMPGRIDEQLDANARDFFSRPKNFRYDRQNRRFYASSILDWFGDDFGATQQAQLKRIAPWLPTDAARQAARRGSVRVSYLDYNWKLNDQKTAEAAHR